MSPDQMQLVEKFQDEEQREPYDYYCLDGSLDNEEAPVCAPLEFISSFEIGIWKPVPTEPRRRRRQKAERKPHEIIDFSKIDFDHIPGPPLDLKHDCPCKLRALRKWQRLSFLLPDLMAKVTDYLTSTSRHLLKTESKKYLFRSYKGLLEFHVHRPLISYFGCNVEMIRTYFERRFVMTPCAMASVFTNSYLISKIMYVEKEQRRLTRIFHRVLYSAAAEVTYLFLSLHMTKTELNARGWAYLREIKDFAFDPCRIARNSPAYASAIGQKYFAYYSSRHQSTRKRLSRLRL